MHEGHRARVREKVYRHGESLGDHELLEALLFYSLPRKNTNTIAHELLDSFGGFERLFEASPAAIERISGVGEKTVDLIYLVGEMTRRIREREGRGVKRLKSSAQVREFAAERFQNCSEEVLEIYCLGAGGALLCVKSFRGGDDKSVTVYSKNLSRLLASVQPVSVIVAHNHPSGKCEPSAEDDAAAVEIFRICRVNGVQLSDCMIFADGEAPYSYFLSNRFAALGIDREAKETHISVSRKKEN